MSQVIADQPARPSGFFRRAGWFLLSNPLSQIIIGFLLVGVGASVGQELGRLLPAFGGVSLKTPLGAVFALAAYAVFVRFYERRWPPEIAAGGLVLALPCGFAIGVSLLLASAGLIYSGGWSVVTKTAPSADWLRLIGAALTLHFSVAVVEELLLRGIFFRILERSLGSWLALALSALLFGLLHVGNPNATWAAALGLGLQAGVLLAAVYMVSRTLWLPIGLHWGWNAMQAGVVGGTVSGRTANAVITTRPAGPELLSGGEFGVEGSIIATGLCAAVAIAFCVVAVRRGRIQPGFWSTRAEPVHTVHTHAEPGPP